jgi:uncharacterized protein YbjT (DUF2867 family)
MAASKSILVTGATGKQGGALISSLLASRSTSPFNIIALTRNTNSARAKSLASKPNVTILEGDLDDCPAIFSKLTSPLHGVFSVQVPLKAKVEEKQGKDLIDAAASFGVKHFVYTSVDRGGPERSDLDGSVVPHFRSKFNIENHLKTVGPKHGMDWTIIRPVAFMDNLTPDFLGRGFATLWKINGAESRLQLVASRDVGKLATEAFISQEEFKGRALSLASDELSWQEANDTFKAFVGTDLPMTYGWIGHVLRFVLHEHLGIMFKWFVDVGFGADPKAFKGKIPELLTFDAWLRTESGFKD